MVNMGERSRRYSRHPLKARARPIVQDAIPTVVVGRAENVWAAREEGEFKLILRHSSVQTPRYIDSPRESWRVIPLRGLLHVKKHPLLTRAA